MLILKALGCVVTTPEWFRNSLPTGVGGEKSNLLLFAPLAVVDLFAEEPKLPDKSYVPSC